jgi:hypothetical protein
MLRPTELNIQGAGIAKAAMLNQRFAKGSGGEGLPLDWDLRSPLPTGIAGVAVVELQHRHNTGVKGWPDYGVTMPPDSRLTRGPTIKSIIFNSLHYLICSDWRVLWQDDVHSRW